MQLIHANNQWQTVVNTVIKVTVPQNSGNVMESWVTISLQRTALDGVNYY